MTIELRVNKFSQQIQAMHRRLAALYSEATNPLVVQPEVLLPIAFKELGSTAEILKIAADHLLELNDELADTRAAMAAFRQRYHTLFECSADAYLIIDCAGTILEANRAAISLLKTSQENLCGLSLLQYLSEVERHRFRSQINQLLQYDKAPEWVGRFYPPKGQPFDAALTINIVHNADASPSLCICIRNITESQQALKVLNTDNYNPSQDRQKHFYSKGEIISLNPQTIWLVCQGIVKLSTICENGNEALMGLAGEQMVFGSSLTSLPIYQATALSPNVQLVSISLQEIAASPSLAQVLLPKINRRLQQTESFLMISRQLQIHERLRHLLLLLKQEFGQPVEQGTRLSIRLTHNDIASACCTTRVTMTRLLSQLQQQGKISFDAKKHIILVDDLLELG